MRENFINVHQEKKVAKIGKQYSVDRIKRTWIYLPKMKYNET